MIWCVPANNRSSTWNTSDTRFVVCVHRQVRDEAALPEDLFQMVPTNVSVRFADHAGFLAVSRSLFPCWDPVFQVATQVVALHTPHHSPPCVR